MFQHDSLAIINKSLEARYGDKLYYDIKNDRFIKYSEIAIESIPYLIGNFVKIISSEDALIICGDIMGETGAMFRVDNGSLKIYFGVKEVIDDGLEINKRVLSEVYSGSGFVKSEVSPFVGLQRISAFCYYLINKIDYSVKTTLHDMAWVNWISTQTEKSLFKFITKGFQDRMKSGTLLYSGGLDSKLIQRMFKIEHLFNFNTDSEYEPNNRDSIKVLKDKSIEGEIWHYRPAKTEMLKYINSLEYQDDLLSMLGYNHSTVGFSLAMKNVGTTIIISGQNADTVGFFGPSESVSFNSYGIRNIKMVLARIRLMRIIRLARDKFIDSYSAVFNDSNYSFRPGVMPESEKVIAQKLHDQNLPKCEIHTWYGLLVAKMRAFGTGADISVQRNFANKHGKEIVFPFNCLPFAELGRRKMIKNRLFWLLVPKRWYFGITGLNLIDYEMGVFGSKDYRKTTTYRAVEEARSKFVENLKLTDVL